jgi:hypothetical protein
MSTPQTGLVHARARKLRIVQPRPNEVQIDIDSVRALDTFARQWSMLRAHGHAQGWRAKIDNSHTPGHCHVTITLPRPRPLRERVLLAALLGSDPKREMFNYCRVLERRRIPVCFFEKRSAK